MGGKADASVDDLEEKLCTGVVTLAVEAEADGAVVGEFDGVAEEVGKDLADAGGVGVEGFGDGAFVFDGEAEVFAGDAFTDEAGRFGDELGGVVVDAVDGHFVGFDLGEVEDVVDEGDEVSAVAADGLDEGLALVGGEVFFEEVGEAEDGGHGGADFVGHVGEELAFGSGGLLGFFLGAAEFLLGFLAAGDIEVGADDAERFAVFVAFDDLSAAEEPDPTAVLMAEAVFVFVGGGFAGEVFLEFFPACGVVVGVAEGVPGGDGVGGQFLGLIADGGEPAGGEDDVTGGDIPVPEGFLSGVEGEFEAFAGDGEFFFGEAGGGDVFDDVAEAGMEAVGIADGGDGGEEGMVGVGEFADVFEVDWAVGAGGFVHFFDVEADVGFRDTDGGRGFADEIFGVFSQEACCGGIDGEVPGVAITEFEDAHHIRGGIVEAAEDGFIGLDFLLGVVAFTDEFLEFDELAAHLDFAHDLAGEGLECLDLVVSELVGADVDDAEGTDGVAIGADERGAGVEADVLIADDEGIAGEAGVGGGIGHLHKEPIGDGVVAEGQGAGRFGDVGAGLGLEPLAVVIEDADEADGGAADAGGEGGDVVEGGLGGRVEEAGGVDGGKARGLIGGDGIGGRGAGFGRIHRHDPSEASGKLE